MRIKAIVYRFIVLYLFFFIATTASYAQKIEYAIKTVVIDAGHGGKDPGAVGKISYEKNIVLPIALQLGQLIEHNFPGLKVLYTRNTDTYVKLKDRGNLANKNKADLFISIHANSNPDSTHEGCETYAMGLHTTQKNMDVAKLENSVIVLEDDYKATYENFEPKNTESYIIFSLMQKAYLEQSLVFAALVQEQFGKYTGRQNRGVKQAGFVVLWHTAMPSVLIETGFVSNEDEEKYLNSKIGQQSYALSIYKAFVEYEAYLKKHQTRISDFTYTINLDETISEVLKTNDKHNISEKNITAIEKDKISYEIQICSAINKLPANSPLLKGIGLYKTRNIGNTYKYTVGYSESFNEILGLLEVARKKSPQAFVVAFKGDKKIKVQEAIQLTDK